MFQDLFSAETRAVDIRQSAEHIGQAAGIIWDNLDGIHTGLI